MNMINKYVAKLLRLDIQRCTASPQLQAFPGKRKFKRKRQLIMEKNHKQVIHKYVFFPRDSLSS